MPVGLVGRKLGMTRIFTDAGESIPVSVVEVQPNRVVQVRDVERDGYRAIQVTMGSKKPSRLKRPEAGHFQRANVEPGEGLWEFRLTDADDEGFDVGAELAVTRFSDGDPVDVQGTTIGKGFAGTIKRHHFTGQDNTHGNSLSHRVPGSIGQNQTPGRVFKGKKMSGHLGHVTRSIQNLSVVRVDAQRNLLLISGAIPGPKSATVVVRPAVKRRNSN